MAPTRAGRDRHRRVQRRRGPTRPGLRTPWFSTAARRTHRRHRAASAKQRDGVDRRPRRARYQDGNRHEQRQSTWRTEGACRLADDRDVVVDSCEVGLQKPEARTCRHACSASASTHPTEFSSTTCRSTWTVRLRLGCAEFWSPTPRLLSLMSSASPDSGGCPGKPRLSVDRPAPPSRSTTATGVAADLGLLTSLGREHVAGSGTRRWVGNTSLGRQMRGFRAGADPTR